MESSIWRAKTRTVAIIELVVLCMCVTILLTRIALYAYYIHEEDYYILEDMQMLQVTDYPLINLMWEIIVYAVILFVAGFYIWSANNLLGASKMGQYPQRALKMVTIWVTMEIFLLPLSLLVYVLLDNLWPVLVNLLWNSAVLPVVYQFSRELKIFIISQNNVQCSCQC